MRHEVSSLCLLSPACGSLLSAFCFLPSVLRNLRSKPTTSCFFSKKLCCQESNIWLSELERSGHYLVPLLGDAIVVGFEHLVDQFVCPQ